MEISFEDRVLTINPRRIIYVESYFDNGYSKKNPYKKDEDDNNLPVRFCHIIKIYMTENEKIEYRTDDISGYEELRNRLEKLWGE